MAGCCHEQCGMLLTGPLLEGSGLRKCAGCSQVAYCSKACQQLMWKRKHKNECAALRAACAGVGPQVLPQALRHPQLTAHQLKVIQQLNERFAAEDYRVVVDLKVESSEAAAAVRTTHASISARIYGLLGSGHMHLHLFPAAIGCLNTALSIYEEIRKDELAANRKTNERQNLCNVCGDLASCYRNMCFFERALVLYDRALVVAEEAGDRQALGRVLGNFGCLHRQLGQHASAIGLLEQGLAIAGGLGDREGQGDSWHNLALCSQAMGHYEKAITLHEQSVVMFEVLGDLDNQMFACKGLGESLTLLSHPNFAQAIEQHTNYWALSRQLGDVQHQAQAALNMGVTLWTQGLAERQAAVAAAASADSGSPMHSDLQMQKKGAERLVQAQQWLATALDRNIAAPIITIELDTTLNLSCLAFFMSQKAEALKHLHAHLDLCVKHARDSCAGCWQRRGEDAPMSTCSGCKVARSVLHLRTSSLNQNTYLAHNCYSCKRMLMYTVYAPAADATMRQVLQRRTSEDGVKKECENGQCAAQGRVWAAEEVVWCD
jgi:tetratricopeptide (TPR) repeat protein